MASKLCMRCPLVALFLCACLFLSSAAFAQRTLVVAVDGDWPPMKMKDAQGKLTGFEIDMMNAIGARAGFRVSFVEAPWDSIFTGLKAGKYDAVIASVSITDKRKKSFDFSAPYFSAEQLLVIPKSLVFKSLEGKTIAAFADTTGAAALNQSKITAKKLYPLADMEKPFKDLADGKISGFVCDTPVAIHYAFYEAAYKKKFAIQSEQTIFGKSSPSEQYGIAVKKGNREVLDLMNSGIKAVKAQNADTAIKLKWITW